VQWKDWGGREGCSKGIVIAVSQGTCRESSDAKRNVQVAAVFSARDGFPDLFQQQVN
jgi:hypothetical protein